MKRGAWRSTIELADCLEAVEHKKRAGKANAGTQGLGLITPAKKSLSQSVQAEERQAVLEEFAEKIEGDRYQHCLKLAQWAEWTKWDDVMEQDRDWQKIIMQKNDELWKFEMGALEDTLPTPSILKHWYGKDNGGLDGKCKVCNAAQGSLKHILVHGLQGGSQPG